MSICSGGSKGGSRSPTGCLHGSIRTRELVEEIVKGEEEEEKGGERSG